MRKIKIQPNSVPQHNQVTDIVELARILIMSSIHRMKFPLQLRGAPRQTPARLGRGNIIRKFENLKFLIFKTITWTLAWPSTRSTLCQKIGLFSSLIKRSNEFNQNVRSNVAGLTARRFLHQCNVQVFYKFPPLFPTQSYQFNER